MSGITRLGLCLALLTTLGVAPSVLGQDAQGRVVSLTLFAGTQQGLWWSHDWGRHWKRVVGTNVGVRLDNLGPARTVLPLGPQVYVAGDGGLFVSNDFGDTWNPLSLTNGVESLLFSRWPQADPTVFAGTTGGLLRSRDGGRSFAPTSLATGPVRRIEWPGPSLVVACGQGLLISNDEGQSFGSPGNGFPEGPALTMALSTFFAVDPVLFAAPATGGVYRSGDGGKSWAPAGLADETVRELVWLGPFLYAAGDAGFYRSDDNGRHWERLSEMPGRPSRLLFPLAPAAGLEAFVSTDRGLFYTSDAGQTWSLTGFQGQEVLTVATFPPPRPDLEMDIYR